MAIVLRVLTIRAHEMSNLTLSHRFSTVSSTPTPETILPSSFVIGALTWEIEDHIHQAQRREPDLGKGPPKWALCALAKSFTVPYSLSHMNQVLRLSNRK